MIESPGLIFADATMQLHHAFGILTVPMRQEADRLSPAFAAAGFPNFVLDKLLDVPKPQPLDPHAPELPEPVGLAVTARLDTVVEHETWRFDPWSIRLRSGDLRGLWLPEAGSGLDEYAVEEKQTHFYLDLLTRTAHWRVSAGMTAAVEGCLQRALSPSTYRSASVQKLLDGTHNLVRFRHEEDYDKHVKWLYHVRYARS